MEAAQLLRKGERARDATQVVERCRNRYPDGIPSAIISAVSVVTRAPERQERSIAGAPAAQTPILGRLNDRIGLAVSSLTTSCRTECARKLPRGQLRRVGERGVEEPRGLGDPLGADPGRPKPAPLSVRNGPCPLSR